VDIESMVEARALDVGEAFRWVSEVAGEDSAAARKLAELNA
jgi:hypothetical protein